MTDEEYVLSKVPTAKCNGPVNMYWPTTGERKGRYIISFHPTSSRTEGEGGNPEEAWARAAYRLKRKLAAEVEG